MKRVLVIGCSGSGKSTLAAEVSRKTGLLYVPTDHLYWGSDWKPTPVETVVAELEQAIEQAAWVMDGNFVAQRNLAWRRADTVLWLDLSLGRVLTRIVLRNLRWWLTGRPTWSGNRMTLGRAMSGVRHAFRSHPEKRRCYPGYLREFPHLEVLRFRTPREVHRWLASLKETAAIF